MKIRKVAELNKHLQAISQLLQEKRESATSEESSDATKIIHVAFSKIARELGSEKVNKVLALMDKPPPSLEINEYELEFAKRFFEQEKDTLKQIRFFSGKVYDLFTNQIQDAENPDLTIQRFKDDLKSTNLSDNEKLFLIHLLRSEWFEKAFEILNQFDKGTIETSHADFYESMDNLGRSLPILVLEDSVDEQAFEVISPLSRDKSKLVDQISFVVDQAARAFATLSVLSAQKS